MKRKWQQWYVQGWFLLVAMHFEFFDTIRKHDHLSLIYALYFSELGIFGCRPCPHGEEIPTKPIKLSSRLAAVRTDRLMPLF